MRALACELTTHEPASGEAPALVARGLRKTYGGVDAVAGIDLRIGQGEIFALLGPNGAGKTTAVELLEGFQSRTAGEVSVLGLIPITAPEPGGIGSASCCRSPPLIPV